MKSKWYKMLIFLVMLIFGGIGLAFIDARYYSGANNKFWRELGFCCVLCAMNCVGIMFFAFNIGFGMMMVFIPISVTLGIFVKESQNNA